MFVGKARSLTHLQTLDKTENGCQGKTLAYYKHLLFSTVKSFMTSGQGDNRINLFSSSLTFQPNNLEFLYLKLDYNFQFKNVKSNVTFLCYVMLNLDSYNAKLPYDKTHMWFVLGRFFNLTF